MRKTDVPNSLAGVSVRETPRGSRSPVTSTAVQTVVFDADDTLWYLQPLYQAAEEEIATWITAATGAALTETRSLIHAIDARNIRAMGRYAFSRHRFPKSLLEAYHALCERAGRPVDWLLLERIRQRAYAIFEACAPRRPETPEVLESLRERGYRLVLFTKGDPLVQWKRIDDAGVRPYFEHIEVVWHKDLDAYRSLLGRLVIDPRQAVMVGDSIKSDVNPSLEVGFALAVHCPPPYPAPAFEVEPIHGDRVVTVKDLREILTVLEEARGALDRRPRIVETADPGGGRR